MEYVAFKALAKTRDGLASPSWYAEWVPHDNGTWTLSAVNWGKGGAGVHASRWKDAIEYTGKIYMVVPYYLDDDNTDVSIASFGWRSERATAVAGPFDTEKTMPREIAQQIVAWNGAGYRQVPGVLYEAKCILSRPNALAKARMLSDVGVATPDAVNELIHTLLTYPVCLWSSIESIREFAERFFETNPEAAWSLLWLTGAQPRGKPDINALAAAMSSLERRDRATLLRILAGMWVNLGDWKHFGPQISVLWRLFPNPGGARVGAMASHFFSDIKKRDARRLEMISLVKDYPPLAKEVIAIWGDGLNERIAFGVGTEYLLSHGVKETEDVLFGQDERDLEAIKRDYPQLAPYTERIDAIIEHGKQIIASKFEEA